MTVESFTIRQEDPLGLDDVVYLSNTEDPTVQKVFGAYKKLIDEKYATDPNREKTALETLDEELVDHCLRAYLQVE